MVRNLGPPQRFLTLSCNDLKNIRRIILNACFQQERYRMLRCDGYINNLYANIFDRYCLRSENLDDLSLAEFAVTYECVS